MAARRFPGFAAIAVLHLAVAAPASAAQDRVSFMVSDETDPQEIAEDTSLFVNGLMVAHFDLNAAHPADTLTVSIPAAPQYEYALCGHITLRNSDGSTAIHQVSTGAALPALGNHVYQLLAAGDFTIFYMSDQSSGVPEVPKDVHKAGVCSVPTS